MSDRLPLVGGPLDGHAIARQPGRFAWVAAGPLRRLPRLDAALVGVSAIRSGATACPTPERGRSLYERVGDAYLFAGHRLTLCPDCGAYHGRAEGGRERRPCALGGT